MKIIISILLLVSFWGNSTKKFEEFQRQAGEEMSNGNYANALGFYEQAMELIEEDAKHPSLFALAGMCAQKSQNGKQAIEYYTIAIDQGIEEAQIFESLATIYQEAGLSNKEAEVYLQAIERLPLEAKSFRLKLCQIYKSQDNSEALLSTANQVLVDYPQCSRALEYKAYAYKSSKQIDNALIAYGELLNVEPENINANIFLGNYNYKMGRKKLDALRKNYDAIARPSRMQWHEHNKKVKQTMEQYFRPATKHFEIVYKQKPKSSIQKMLYAMYSKLGDEGKAAEYKPE